MKKRNLHLITPEMAELWAEHQQQEKIGREIDRAYVPERIPPDTYEERAKGDVVRAVLELDRLIRRTGFSLKDLKGYQHLPHTFPSTVFRLAAWLPRLTPGQLADAELSPGPASPTQSGTVT